MWTKKELGEFKESIRNEGGDSIIKVGVYKYNALLRVLRKCLGIPLFLHQINKFLISYIRLVMEKLLLLEFLRTRREMHYSGNLLQTVMMLHLAFSLNGPIPTKKKFLSMFLIQKMKIWMNMKVILHF